MPEMKCWVLLGEDGPPVRVALSAVAAKSLLLLERDGLTVAEATLTWRWPFPAAEPAPAKPKRRR